MLWFLVSSTLHILILSSFLSTFFFYYFVLKFSFPHSFFILLHLHTCSPLLSSSLFLSLPLAFFFQTLLNLCVCVPFLHISFVSSTLVIFLCYGNASLSFLSHFSFHLVNSFATQFDLSSPFFILSSFFSIYLPLSFLVSLSIQYILPPLFHSFAFIPSSFLPYLLSVKQLPWGVRRRKYMAYFWAWKSKGSDCTQGNKRKVKQKNWKYLMGSFLTLSYFYSSVSVCVFKSEVRRTRRWGK